MSEIEQLHAELEQYREAGNSPRLIEILAGYAENESDPIRIASWRTRAAVICRDRICNFNDAIEQYQYALDAYFMRPELLGESMLPVAMSCFDEIEKLCAVQADWKQLERSHRLMIRRLKGEKSPVFVKLQADLCEKLAEIYHSRLGHVSSAVAALEMAQELEPGNEARAAKLAELRQLVPS